MKKILSVIVVLFAFTFTNAQTIVVHNGADTMYAKTVTTIDSIKLDTTYSKFNIAGNSSAVKIKKAFIDSITFTNNAVSLNKIYLTT